VEPVFVVEVEVEVEVEVDGANDTDEGDMELIFFMPFAR
jgi:hypothetical protein